MEERVSWVHHRGKQIILEDLTGCVGPQIVDVLQEATQFVRPMMDRRDLLVLVDVSGGAADRKSLKVFKEHAKKNKKIFAKRAVVGVEGVLGFFLDLVERFAGVHVACFETREEALDWLASDD